MFSQTLLRSQWLLYSKHYTVFPSVSFLSRMLWMPLLNCCFSSKALFLSVVHIYRQVAKLVIHWQPQWKICFAKKWSCVLTVTSILSIMRTEDKICNQSGFPLMVEKYYIFQARSHTLQNYYKPPKTLSLSWVWWHKPNPTYLGHWGLTALQSKLSLKKWKKKEGGAHL